MSWPAFALAVASAGLFGWLVIVLAFATGVRIADALICAFRRLKL